jgi:hypothetical protein
MSISVGNAAEMSAPTPIQAVKRQESGDMERADMYKHIRRHRAGRNRSREFASPKSSTRIFRSVTRKNLIISGGAEPACAAA